jgi:branched-chain amino acid transport system permease protein
MMQITMNGMINGLTIALLAAAFNAVYLPTRIFYIAMGGIFTTAPFIAWSLLKAGAGWFGAISVALITGTLLSLLCEWINHRRLERRQASPGAHLISSLGIYIIIVQVIAILWGNETKVLRSGVDSIWPVGSIILTGAQCIAAAVSIAFLVALFTWLHITHLGLQFRALADNPVECALRGHNVNRLRLLAFGIGGFLASAASLLIAYDLGFNPQGGLSILILAIAATIIGGRVSLVGPFLGGILLGLLRSQVVWFLSARWQDAVTFFLLVVFLYACPQGILGRRARLEAR